MHLHLLNYDILNISKMLKTFISFPGLNYPDIRFMADTSF